MGDMRAWYRSMVEADWGLGRKLAGQRWAEALPRRATLSKAAAAHNATMAPRFAKRRARMQRKHGRS